LSSYGCVDRDPFLTLRLQKNVMIYYTWAGRPKSASCDQFAELGVPSPYSGRRAHSYCPTNMVNMSAFSVPLSSTPTTCIGAPTPKYRRSEEYETLGCNPFRRFTLSVMSCIAYPIGFCLGCCDVMVEICCPSRYSPILLESM